MAYIYLITNNVNNKVYVGKTEDSIEKRFAEHCSDSKKDRCKNRPLYRAMNKYGCENFSVSLLEETDQPEIREEYWIEQKQSYHNGYNATRGGDGKKYLDYDLIYTTYCELQNATQTAAKLGISFDTVQVVVRQRGRMKSTQEISREAYGKSIAMYDSTGNLEQIFETLNDAARFLQANNLTPTISSRGIAAHIRDCANGKRKTAYKKAWQWN
jgi:predicted GIY-YIG superfamily endonuclease